LLHSIRVDLILDDPPAYTSVTFHEQKLFVSVGLLQGFQVTGIDLTRLNATEESGSADFDYELESCQCDSEGTCVNSVLTQGSDVLLCLVTSAPNVEIVDIRSLVMTQGSFNSTPIVSGVEDPLTEVTIDGKEASIRYQIISAFFSDPDPEDIVATGAALLAFTDDNGRRLLRSANVVARQLVEETGEEGWSVRMAAESDEPESSGAFACGSNSLVTMIVALVGAVGGSVMVF